MPARSVSSNPLRAIRGEFARWRLGRFPAAPTRRSQTCALGSGADGDHRGGADPSGGARPGGTHPRRGARRRRCLVGDGGGPSVLVAKRRHRRDPGRPEGPRLHRHPPAGGGGGALASALLAGAPRRHRQFERRAHALADRQQPVLGPLLRSESAGLAGMGRRIVPRARLRAGTLERRP